MNAENAELRGVADGSVDSLLCLVVFEVGEVVRELEITNIRVNASIRNPRLPWAE